MERCKGSTNATRPSSTCSSVASSRAPYGAFVQQRLDYYEMRDIDTSVSAMCRF